MRLPITSHIACLPRTGNPEANAVLSLRRKQTDQAACETEGALRLIITILPLPFNSLIFIILCWVKSMNVKAHFQKPKTSNFSCYSSGAIKYLSF